MVDEAHRMDSSAPLPVHAEELLRSVPVGLAVVDGAGEVPDGVAG